MTTGHTICLKGGGSLFIRGRNHCCQILGGIVLLVLCLGQLTIASEASSMGGYESYGIPVDLEKLEQSEGDAPPILIGTLVGATVGFGSYVVTLYMIALGITLAH